MTKNKLADEANEIIWLCKWLNKLWLTLE